MYGWQTLYGHSSLKDKIQYLDLGLNMRTEKFELRTALFGRCYHIATQFPVIDAIAEGAHCQIAVPPMMIMFTACLLLLFIPRYANTTLTILKYSSSLTTTISITVAMKGSYFSQYTEVRL